MGKYFNISLPNLDLTKEGSRRPPQQQQQLHLPWIQVTRSSVFGIVSPFVKVDHLDLPIKNSSSNYRLFIDRHSQPPCPDKELSLAILDADKIVRLVSLNQLMSFIAMISLHPSQFQLMQLENLRSLVRNCNLSNTVGVRWQPDSLYIVWPGSVVPANRKKVIVHHLYRRNKGVQPYPRIRRNRRAVKYNGARNKVGDNNSNNQVALSPIYVDVLQIMNWKVPQASLAPHLPPSPYPYQTELLLLLLQPEVLTTTTTTDNTTIQRNDSSIAGINVTTSSKSLPVPVPVPVPVANSDQSWLHYDETNKNLRLSPTSANIGTTKLLVCVSSEVLNQTCFPLKVIVRPLPGQTRQIHLRSPPSNFLILYTLPLSWFRSFGVREDSDIQIQSVAASVPISYSGSRDLQIFNMASLTGTVLEIKVSLVIRNDSVLPLKLQLPVLRHPDATYLMYTINGKVQCTSSNIRRRRNQSSRQQDIREMFIRMQEILRNKTAVQQLRILPLQFDTVQFTSFFIDSSAVTWGLVMPPTTTNGNGDNLPECIDSSLISELVREVNNQPGCHISSLKIVDPNGSAASVRRQHQSSELNMRQQFSVKQMLEYCREKQKQKQKQKQQNSSSSRKGNKESFTTTTLPSGSTGKQDGSLKLQNFQKNNVTASSTKSDDEKKKSEKNRVKCVMLKTLECVVTCGSLTKVSSGLITRMQNGSVVLNSQLNTLQTIELDVKLGQILVLIPTESCKIGKFSVNISDVKLGICLQLLVSVRATKFHKSYFLMETTLLSNWPMSVTNTSRVLQSVKTFIKQRCPTELNCDNYQLTVYAARKLGRQGCTLYIDIVTQSGDRNNNNNNNDDVNSMSDKCPLQHAMFLTSLLPIVSLDSMTAKQTAHMSMVRLDKMIHQNSDSQLKLLRVQIRLQRDCLNQKNYLIMASPPDLGQETVYSNIPAYVSLEPLQRFYARHIQDIQQFQPFSGRRRRATSTTATTTTTTSTDTTVIETSPPTPAASSSFTTSSFTSNNKRGGIYEDDAYIIPVFSVVPNPSENYRKWIQLKRYGAGKIDEQVVVMEVFATTQHVRFRPYVVELAVSWMTVNSSTGRQTKSRQPLISEQPTFTSTLFRPRLAIQVRSLMRHPKFHPWIRQLNHQVSIDVRMTIDGRKRTSVVEASDLPPLKTTLQLASSLDRVIRPRCLSDTTSRRCGSNMIVFLNTIRFSDDNNDDGTSARGGGSTELNYKVSSISLLTAARSRSGVNVPDSFPKCPWSTLQRMKDKLKRALQNGALLSTFYGDRIVKNNAKYNRTNNIEVSERDWTIQSVKVIHMGPCWQSKTSYYETDTVVEEETSDSQKQIPSSYSKFPIITQNHQMFVMATVLPACSFIAVSVILGLAVACLLQRRYRKKLKQRARTPLLLAQYRYHNQQQQQHQQQSQYSPTSDHHHSMRVTYSPPAKPLILQTELPPDPPPNDVLGDNILISNNYTISSHI